MATAKQGRRTTKHTHPVPRVTRAQKDEFLLLVASGKSRPEAARLVKSTGTRMRSLVNPLAPNYDPVFATAYAAALEAQGPAIVDDLREELVARALDRKHHSDRPLHQALLLYDPEYRAAHQQRLAVGAKAGADGEIQILLAFEGPADGD